MPVTSWAFITNTSKCYDVTISSAVQYNAVIVFILYFRYSHFFYFSACLFASSTLGIEPLSAPSQAWLQFSDFDTISGDFWRFSCDKICP